VQGRDLFATVPGIGRELARRIRDRLGIETLQELEVAAWDGRLRGVPGLGRGRVLAVRESLAGRFRRPPPRVAPRRPEDEPPVAELLDVDLEYRTKAARGELVRIAPQRFNPARPGSPCCTCGAASATTHRSSRTPRGRTSSARRATGS
jgi:hypothetical protein